MTKQLILDDVRLHPHTYISLYSELATLVLEYSSLDSIYVTDENGDERMTEEKQDEYCYIVSMVEHILNYNGLIQEDSDEEIHRMES